MVSEFQLSELKGDEFPTWETETSSRPGGDGSGFLQALRKCVSDVNQQQGEADESLVRFYTGETKDIHSVAIAMKKAELSFNYLLAIRNQALKAYQKLSSLQ